DRLGAAAEVGFVESSLDASLAVGQFLSYALVHLKSLVAWSGGERSILHENPETPRGFELFHLSLRMKAFDIAFVRSSLESAAVTYLVFRQSARYLSVPSQMEYEGERVDEISQLPTI